MSSNRKYLVIAIFFTTGMLFILRLFYLQVVDTSYQEYATSNVLRKVVQYSARGLIYDRNGELLVYNKAAYDLMVIPREVTPFDTVSFSAMLDISVDEFRQRLKDARQYSLFRPSLLVKQISPEQYAVIQEQLYKVRGFFFQSRTLREYAHPLAAHVLGYVGEVSQNHIDENPYYQSGDYIGISGIEKTYEHVLRGQKGAKYYMVDVHNRIQGSYLNGEADTTAVIGSNLTSSLDVQLQMYAEQLLRNKRGSIVAIEPATGEVLVMANSPAYDPGLLVGRARGRNYLELLENPVKPLYDRALMAQYPPGSTFKMANALIALQEGVITPQTQFRCNHGYQSGSFRLACHHSESFTLIPSISRSCNAYYVYVFRAILENRHYSGIREAYDAWRNHLLRMGIGQTLNTDFAHELGGLVPTSAYYEQAVFRGARWRALPIVSLSIGQGELGVTPLQLANHAAMLANRGHYYIPHIVRQIENGAIDPRFRTPVESGIDRHHFDDVIEGMEQVMVSGTGARSRVPGISICGKTGTAQNPHGADHSVFMAFAPKDDPKIAISVYIEAGIWGSTYAAPIASLIIEKYLNGEISEGRKWMEENMLNANLMNDLKIVRIDGTEE